MRAQLANIPDVTGQFNSVRATAGRQHLFTDGACMLQDVKGLTLAGWGVISASTGDVVSCAPLHGVWQTGPRAELCAVISAVRWAIATRVAVNLWTDCKHVVLGVQRLLDSPWDPLPIDNQDLWSQSAQLLQQLESGFLQIVHIPSHLDPARCESPFEEWVARHNAHTVQATFLKSCARVVCRSPGLLMGADVELMKKARARLSEFTATRPIRKSCDSLCTACAVHGPLSRVRYKPSHAEF